MLPRLRHDLASHALVCSDAVAHTSCWKTELVGRPWGPPGQAARRNRAAGERALIHSYCWERGSGEEPHTRADDQSLSPPLPTSSRCLLARPLVEIFCQALNCARQEECLVSRVGTLICTCDQRVKRCLSRLANAVGGQCLQIASGSPRQLFTRFVVPTCLELASGVAFISEQKIDLLSPSMKTNLRRICALFPWMAYYNFRAESYKQGGGDPNMATELRGLGAQAWLDRDNGYTSLRDLMPQKEINSLRKLTFPEISSEHAAAIWRNDTWDDYGRTPKTPLLGSAMQLWLSSSVVDRTQQQGNVFTRCWQRFTRQNSLPPTVTPPRNTFRFTFTFTDCVGYFPFLKYFDLSHAFSALVNRLRQPQAFASLRQ
ncbi:hypothetical protein R1sor_014581 [Riccia sorocarpa]|uniref:Uncharacterized protein n=1 Tax=Riccia sorocarpa TaxID=122646 RepID=A0ABD3HCT0_9MARC